MRGSSGSVSGIDGVDGHSRGHGLAAGAAWSAPMPASSHLWGGGGAGRTGGAGGPGGALRGPDGDNT